MRVLFPVDPAGDQRVRAGKKYELKGRGGREAFVADDTTGHGTVLAAVAETPFRFDEFEKNGHWNYGALNDSTVHTDPEAGLMGLAQRMQGSETAGTSITTWLRTRCHRRHAMSGGYTRTGGTVGGTPGTAGTGTGRGWVSAYVSGDRSSVRGGGTTRASRKSWKSKGRGSVALSPSFVERRRSESNRRIEVLQTSALPLGYGAN